MPRRAKTNNRRRVSKRRSTYKRRTPKTRTLKPPSDKKPVATAVTTAQLVASSWKRVLSEKGFIHLDEGKVVLDITDLENPEYVWCFCDCLYLNSRYEVCPRCDMPKTDLQ